MSRLVYVLYACFPILLVAGQFFNVSVFFYITSFLVSFTALIVWILHRAQQKNRYWNNGRWQDDHWSGTGKKKPWQ